MARPPPRIDRSQLRTLSARRRTSKVGRRHEATPHRRGARFAAFGVAFNVGSGVILPEVFLKALSLARNPGHRVRRFTTVDLDFIRHYRPAQNVVERPTRLGGRGISLMGQHEILVPLLVAGIIEKAEGRRR